MTIHEHLDETVSIRFGPHVVGRYDREGLKLTHCCPKQRGKARRSAESKGLGVTEIEISDGGLSLWGDSLS